jgi:hypothetical protein
MVVVAKYEYNTPRTKKVMIQVQVCGSVHLEKQIEWCYKSSAHSEDSYIWLKPNIPTLLKKHGKVAIYIWLGACDLTKKTDKFIFLNENAITSFNNKLEDFRALAVKNTDVKVTFLHIPYYSIEKWNQTKGNQNAEQFKTDDKK